MRAIVCKKLRLRLLWCDALSPRHRCYHFRNQGRHDERRRYRVHKNAIRTVSLREALGQIIHSRLAAAAPANGSGTNLDGRAAVKGHSFEFAAGEEAEVVTVW